MAAARKIEELAYTYKMYCEMPDDGNRYEIIDGVPRMMAAPNRQHQGVLGSIYARLYNFLRGWPCRVYASPFDVRLSLYGDFGDDAINVVQPDVMVFCDRTKLDDKGAIGPPDIAVEVISPSSAKNDRYRKFRLYEKAGVREYWIVDGVNETVEVYALQNGKFSLNALFGSGDSIKSTVLEGLEIDVAAVFLDAE